MDEPNNPDQQQSDVLSLKAAYLALIEGYVRKHLQDDVQRMREHDNASKPTTVYPTHTGE